MCESVDHMKKKKKMKHSVVGKKCNIISAEPLLNVKKAKADYSKLQKCKKLK